jgi:hypothetical protein
VRDERAVHRNLRVPAHPAGEQPQPDGGTSVEAHRAGLERVVQAGGQPVSWVALACELQRDWNRQETVSDIVQIVITERLSKE